MNLNPQPHQRTFLECNGTETKEPIRIVFFGGGAGGGKTWSILVDNLFGVHDPDYYSAFFRKTTTELETNLWPEAKKMYMPLLKDENDSWIGKSHINEQNKVITFPSGARSKFSYLEYDKHADSWYGSELTKVYVDEFQMFSEYAFDVLRSRNRSRANVTKGMRFTLNPDPTHFMYEWIKPFLDSNQEFPVDELGGKTRYYVIKEGVLHTDWDKEALREKTGKNPQTYTYVPAKLEDNKVLMEMDPEYFDNLDSQGEAKRNQLLLGSWKIVNEETGLYFKREWLKKASHVPVGAKWARGWDTAATLVEEGKKLSFEPDWTVGVRMARCRDGYYYLCGMNRFQDAPGSRDKKMILQGKQDGSDTHIVLGVDGGSAGKFQFQEFSKKAAEEQLVCRSDNLPTNKSKLKRFEPFSASCQNGIVYIVESTFSSEELKAFYKELEEFTGDTKTKRGYHDDVVDACSSVFAYLSSKNTYKFTPRSQNTVQTETVKVLSNSDGLQEQYQNLDKPDITKLNQ